MDQDRAYWMVTWRWKNGQHSESHVVVETFNNEAGQTACGISYDRSAVVYTDLGPLDPEAAGTCQNCVRAVMSTPED